MISEKLQAAINAQINAEMWSAYLYLSMSAYCQDAGLPGMANWYAIQFKEEQDHAMAPFMERPIVIMGQDVRNALEQLICMMCGLEKNSDLLWWWAFEDVEKVIKVDSERVYDVSTLEGLYKYILDGIERVDKNEEM